MSTQRDPDFFCLTCDGYRTPAWYEAAKYPTLGVRYGTCPVCGGLTTAPMPEPEDRTESMHCCGGQGCPSCVPAYRDGGPR